MSAHRLLFKGEKLFTLAEVEKLGGYDIILADPPWSYRNGGRGAAQNHYETMPDAALAKLPVARLAAPDSVLFLWVTWPTLPVALATMRAWGYCVSPETRVLTADLKWLSAEDLRKGQRLVGFDENPRPTQTGSQLRRYLDWSHVTSTGIEKMPSHEVRLSDGTKLRCSSEHPWLVRDVCRGVGDRRQNLTRWMRACDMVETLKHSRRRRALMMPRLVPVATPREDYIGGFLSAAFDGEGCIRRKHGSAGGLAGIGFAQNQNSFLLKVEDYLAKAGYDYSRYNIPQKKVKHVNVRAGVGQTLRFLMEMRPPRLLDNWSTVNIDQTSLYNLDQREVEVEEVVSIGNRNMCTLSTSTKTYIAEGFGAHNTYKTLAFLWVKHYEKSGKPFWGGGFWTRSNSEICLLGVRGDLRRVDAGVHQLVETWDEQDDLTLRAPNGEHSAKPPEVRERIVKLMGNLPARLELFARNRADGWEVHGDQVPGGSDIDLEVGNKVDRDCPSCEEGHHERCSGKGCDCFKNHEIAGGV